MKNIKVVAEYNKILIFQNQEEIFVMIHIHTRTKRLQRLYIFNIRGDKIGKYSWAFLIFLHP